VGARRDDITSVQRAQIAIKVLNTDRPHGAITEMAEAYGISRQTIYDIGVAGEQVLIAGLEPGPHGPQPREKTIHVDRNRLARSAVVLTGEGVSQRGIPRCLSEMLDTELLPGWVNGELAKVEAAATTVNAGWQPAVNETLSGAEIYANGLPNLLLVGNDSLYIYALTRQSVCDGDTWGCVLLDAPEMPQFASDAGGEQLQAWEGRIYEKLSTNLVNWAEALFSYHPLLVAALAPLIERWGAPAIQALSRIWQIEAHEKRYPLPWLERQARRVLWEESLAKASSLLGPEQLWLAGEALSQTLDRSWRGSMLAECVNSRLRPILDGRKHTDQGCLELLRFLHNVPPCARGKHAGFSPAQLVGLDIPDDVLTLLGLDSKQSPFVNDDTSDSPLSPSPNVADFVPLTLLLADHALEYQEVSI